MMSRCALVLVAPILPKLYGLGRPTESAKQSEKNLMAYGAADDKTLLWARDFEPVDTLG